MDDIISLETKLEFETLRICPYERVRDETELFDREVPVPISVMFFSNVFHYTYDHSYIDSPAVDFASRVVAGRETKKTTCACDIRKLSSSREILSKTMHAANPKIMPGSVLHNEIVDEILKVVNDYTDPKKIRSIEQLHLEVIIREDVYDRCECEECRAIRESIEQLTVPASESSIKNLKRVKVVTAVKVEEDHDRPMKRRRIGSSKSGNNRRPSDDDDCPICSDEFTAGKYVTQMPCLHSFHKDCIKTWLRRSHFCPICRHEMPMADDRKDEHR